MKPIGNYYFHGWKVQTITSEFGLIMIGWVLVTSESTPQKKPLILITKSSNASANLGNHYRFLSKVTWFSKPINHNSLSGFYRDHSSRILILKPQIFIAKQHFYLMWIIFFTFVRTSWHKNDFSSKIGNSFYL